MLLGKLGASLLENLLTGKNTIRWGSRWSIFLTWSHPLINFEIQRCYQKEPKFNGVYSRNSFSKIKDGACVTNLDEFKSIITHWMALYVNGNNNAIYFDSFGV